MRDPGRVVVAGGGERPDEAVYSGLVALSLTRPAWLMVQGVSLL